MRCGTQGRGAIGPIEGHVRFENVTFSYAGDDEPALRDIDLDVPAGSVIGILGPTGAGKSRLVSLIPRFYDATPAGCSSTGRTCGDQAGGPSPPDGLVFQETFLFSTSIRENISFARREATFEEIIARGQPGARPTTSSCELPDGYETLVGERGLGLSGGQKQRIAIARAILADPRILILDDATASVDMETEHEIQEALKTLDEGQDDLHHRPPHFVGERRRSDHRDGSGTDRRKGTHEELLAFERALPAYLRRAVQGFHKRDGALENVAEDATGQGRLRGVRIVRRRRGVRPWPPSRKREGAGPRHHPALCLPRRPGDRKALRLEADEPALCVT